MRLKKTVSLWGIIAFAAIIMLAITSCMEPEEPPDSGSHTVSQWRIYGFEKPRTGGTPVPNITENEQFSGTVTWSPDVDGTFAYNVGYTATITLKAKSGYTFTGVRANSFAIYDLSYSQVGYPSNAADSGVVTVSFSPTGSEVVTLYAIPGLTVPVHEREPVTKITETPQYSGTVTWSPAVDGTFANATPYTATVTLTLKPGFYIYYDKNNNVRSDYFRVEGATEAIYTRDASGINIITVKFPPTRGTIRESRIRSLYAPVTGNPVFSNFDDEQYSGTVTWEPEVKNGTFAESTVYTATVIITPKTGYTLDGIGADFFFAYFNGVWNPCHNDANSGIVTVTFPRTIGPITIAAIQGLSVPVTGETPVTEITENEQYRGTVSWSPYIYSGGAFAESTVYTATVHIMTKTGYTLNGILADFFMVEGATTVRNYPEINYSGTINSSNVTVTFPPTSAKVPVNRFEYYWVDQHGSLVTTSGGAVLAAVGEPLDITAAAAGYDVIQWHRNGVNTGQSGDTYNFSSTAAGKYTIGLFVEKDGKPYNTNITITVGTYIITYDINGGTGTIPPKQAVINKGDSVSLASGSGLSKGGYIFGGWNTNASGTGTVYNAGSSYTPTANVAFVTLYAIWIDSSGREENPIPLTAGVWTNGSITSSASDAAVWYSFSVTKGTTYYVWWNDSYQGNSTKTLDVVVSAKYSSGTRIFTDVDSGWTYSQSFTATETGMVKIKVAPHPYVSGKTGTFAIAYRTTNSRP